MFLQIQTELITGLILSFLTLGIFISFRIFDFPDLTTEGSFTLGAAVASALIIKGMHPVLATTVSFAAGCAAGALTGLLHTRLRINKILSGILVLTALYAVNMRVMQGPGVSLARKVTIFTHAEEWAASLFHDAASFEFLGQLIAPADLIIFLVTALIIAFLVWLLFTFFHTNLGLAMRATGENVQMMRSLGVRDDRMITLGISLANGLVALSGAYLAQQVQSTDIRISTGMLVTGFACLLIGEAIVGRRRFGLLLTGAVVGSLLYRFVVLLSYEVGLTDSDVKLVTAAFVVLALLFPQFMRKIRRIGPAVSQADGHA